MDLAAGFPLTKPNRNMNTFDNITFPLSGVIYAVSSVDHEETLIQTASGRIGTCDHDAVEPEKLKHDADAKSIIYHGEHSNGNDWAFYY